MSLLVLLVIGSGLTYVAFVLWPRWPSKYLTADAPSIPITVAGVLFNVPPKAIRNAVQRRGGEQERLDLAFEWPSLLPPDPARKPEPGEQAPERIFITVVGAGSTLSAQERLQSIYPRYLAAESTVGPGGLTIRAFRAESPYRGEDIIAEPGRTDRFLARCNRTEGAGTPGTCLLERRIGAVDLTLRFSRDWLADWRQVMEASDRLIAGLRAAPR